MCRSQSARATVFLWSMQNDKMFAAKNSLCRIQTFFVHIFIHHIILHMYLNKLCGKLSTELQNILKYSLWYSIGIYIRKWT